MQSINPATGEVVWSGQEATRDEIALAFEKARAHFPLWSGLPFEQRSEAIFQFWGAVVERRGEIEQTLSQEMGKPRWESHAEVGAIEGKITASIESSWERTGHSERQVGGANLITRHRPHGVLAVFSPFNFPVHMPCSHMIPALLAGNCVLLKPSEHTPATSELLYQCFAESGLAGSAVHLLQGGGDVGRAITSHRDLDGLLFTGSSRTGHLLAEQFARSPEKMLALEMGGNSPVVVTDVADRDAAAYAIIQSAFITSGQRCTCARRLILLRSEANEQLLDRVVEIASNLRVGPFDKMPEPFMGPLVSEAAAKKVIEQQERIGGNPLLVARREGAFVTAGITRVEQTVDEECFGPLLQVIWRDSFEELIEEANRTEYGLAAALLSDHRLEWARFVESVRAGVINWNRPTTGASGSAPFGGLGKSGNLRPTAYYAADQVAHPVASFESERAELPGELSPGVEL